MRMLGILRFSLEGGWGGLLLLAAALTALSAVLYRRAVRFTGPVWGTALLFLKTAALLLVLFLIFRPTLEYSDASTARQRLLAVVDDSRSMRLKDSLQGKERLRAAKDLLLQDGLLDGLPEFEVELAALSNPQGRLSRAELEKLEANGGSSDLEAALREAALARGADRLAGVILLSDGADAARSASEQPLAAPVFSVGLGSDAPPESAARDLIVASVRSDEFARTESVFTVLVEIRGAGPRAADEPETAEIRIRRGDTVVASAEVRVPQRGRIEEAALHFTPKEEGLEQYTVELEALDQEATAENNRWSFSVQVRGQKIRLLLLDGVLRLEFKFLKLALLKDPGIELAAMALTSRDRLLQQGGDLAQGFPSSRQGMRRYDAIVLGDIPPGFFTAEQVEDLKRYVSEDGGGLLMIGGTSSFESGAWAGTALEHLLPFSLGEGGLGHENTPLWMFATFEGKRHPVFHGCLEYFEGGGDLKLPHLEGASRIARLKPGAALLAAGAGASLTAVPLLAVQRYGEGKCAGFTADTTWRWYLELKGQGLESPYHRFWGQLLRWLARTEKRIPDLENPLMVWTDKRNYAPGERVEVSVRALPSGQGEPEAVPVLVSRAEPGGGDSEAEARRLECRRSPGEEPLWRGNFTAPGGAAPGGGESLEAWRLSARLDPTSGAPERAEAFFSVGGVPTEFFQTAMDRKALTALGERTGGAFYNAVQAARIPADLRKRQEASWQVKTQAASEHWLFFPALLFLLALEWGLRKKKLLVSLLVALLPLSLAGAEDLEGAVRLSDGTVQRGRLPARSKKGLQFYSFDSKSREELAVESLKKVTVQIESVEMVQAWRFVEEGSPEKKRWGDPYPRHTYCASVEMAGGARRRGYLTGVIYLETENQAKGPPRKFMLRKYQEGAKGQRSEDLVFVEELAIENPDGAAGRGAGRAEIAIAGGPAPESALAFSLESGRSIPGIVKEGAARWDALAPGIYSFCLEGAGEAAVGWSGEGLTPEEESEVARFAASCQDFFDRRQVLGAVKSGEGTVHVLIDQSRSSESTSYGAGAVFRQVAVWSVYRAEKRWVIDGRTILFRERRDQGQSFKKVALWREGAGLEAREEKPVKIQFHWPSSGEEGGKKS